MKREFSKKLLIADYLIAMIILIILIVCALTNAVYMANIQSELVKLDSAVTINNLFDLSSLTVILSAWIGQLAISSTAYYIMCKSDHKIQLPIKMIDSMSDDIKEKVDLTEIITTVLNTSDN